MNPRHYPLTLLYDGACPLCKLEMDNLKARNGAGLLRFADISTPSFDTTPYTRRTPASLADMQALIHAMRPDGSLVVGVAVFRLAYAAVGLGALVAPTGWPLLRPVVDGAYGLLARHRYGVSRRFMPLIARVAAVRAARRASACHAGVCDTHAAGASHKPKQVSTTGEPS